MADNLTARANTGEGTDQLATDEIGGVHYPRTKLTLGADGTNDGDVSTANPLPVASAALDALARTEDATHASGDKGVMMLGVRNDSFSPMSSADGDYTPLMVTSEGRLHVVTNIAQYEDTQHSDGSPGVMALAVRNDAGDALAGTTGDYIPLTTDASGALRVTGGSGGTQYAEDSAHASGDLGTLALAVRRDADTEMAPDGDYHALTVNSVGRLKVSTMPGAITATTGTITANGQTVAVDISRASNVCLYVTGTFSTINLTFEASIDGGTSWFAVQMVRSNANTVELVTGNLSAAPAYSWEASVNAYTHFRVRATAYTSGTMNVRILPGVYATEPVIATQTTPVTVSSGTVTTVTNLTNWGNVVDNAAFTDGTTRVAMDGFIFDETAGTALTENDAAAARVDSKRAQVLVLEDATTRGRRQAVNASGQAAVTAPALERGIVTCSTDVTRPADTTAYAAGDALANSTSAPTAGGFTFTSAASGAGKAGVITDLLVTSSKATGGLIGELWVFDAAVTAVNDNAAFGVSDTEIKTLVAVIPFATIAGANNSYAHVQGLSIGFTSVGNANLCYLVRLGAAYTPDSAEVITARLKVLQVN